MQRRLSVPNIHPEFIIAATAKTTSTSNTNPIIVGILGTSTYYEASHINQLIETIQTVWGKPTHLIFQQAGNVAMHIDTWAEDEKIPITAVQPEWSKHGPRACMMVNSKIEKEATHIVIIRSPRARSDKMLTKAEYLSTKKGKECLVLMNVETDGSVVIDHYEVPTKPKKPINISTNADIRDMFLPKSKN
jgi:hypothetical protein